MGLVQNTCCNPAAAGPTKKNGECCYVFCEGACCGRPFVVEGRTRVANDTRRADWLRSEKLAIATPSDLGAEDLDEPTRAALARAWLRDARMEHASIASFARFTLELLAVGAPADLVARAQRAGFDEVVHAELCFSMATRYSGEPLGPGCLDVSGAMPNLSLAECAADAVREGCIGETIAALMAREQSAVATDPDAARTLEHIASDEARHAELAWSFVRWALATGGSEVRQRVELAFRQGVAAARSEIPVADAQGVNARAWRRHGRLDDQEARAVLLAALDEIVEPCQRGLFGPEPAAAQSASV